MKTQEKLELIINEPQGHYYLLNNRYQIYTSDGCVYDIKNNTKDIPQEVFDLRDKIMGLLGK